MFKKSRAISIIMFTLFITLLVGCNGLSPTEPNDNVGGAAPVYQGMVLSDSVQTLSAFSQGTISNLSLFTNLSTINTGNDLKDIIANEMPYENTGEIDHFADLNQEVFITVKLLNPDGQAILRFTLNGVVYQSFRFHAGSDSENLILKVNSGTVSGVKEFTIDEIKYVENGTNEIKDAIFDGDRTIKLGVKHGTLPTAQANNLVHNATSMSVNANVSDSSALIAEAGDTLKAFLITNNEVFDSTDLVLGDNTIEFSKLSPNTEYVFVIATIIDVLDGNGKHIYLLLDAQSFTTGTLASIDNVVPTQDSVAFDITVTDADEVGAITAIELYQGETLVEALTDLSLRIFSDLLSNNAYQIKVTYTYDLDDGLGEQELITTETVTTIAKATPEVVVDNVVPTQDSLTFDITVTDADEVGAITAIELYQGETLIEALTDLSEREFTGLLSNNEYTIKATYTYDLNDGVGEQTLTINQAATTLAKATPTMSIDNVVSTQTSILFDITVTDVDQVGAISAIELYKGETLVEALTDLSEREFTGLLSNNEYTIKVTYTYDLNDGVGEQTLIVNNTISTLAKTSPIISITNQNFTDQLIEAELVIADPDLINTITKVELYKNNQLVTDNYNFEIFFDNLDGYTDYTIRISHTFDLNDGSGVTSQTIHFDCKTAPYFNFTDVRVLNTTAVSEGDTIILQANIDNPSNASYSKVIVNGQEYDINDASTQNRLIVEIVNDGQFSDGNTTLIIEEVVATIDGKTYEISVSSNSSADVFINGKIDVLEISFVDSNYNSIDWSFLSDSIYLMVTLDNPTGYTLYNVNGLTTLTKIDDNHYIFPISSSVGWNYFTLNSISYKNDYIDKSTTTISLQTTFYKVNSNEIQYIQTPNDLLNMHGDYYYELANDIDLSGFEWNGGSLNGVFNGNGYSIKNLSVVKTFYDTDVNLGLFTSMNGVAINLNIIDALIIGTLNMTSESSYSEFKNVSIGLLSSRVGRALAKNIFVSGIVNFTNNEGSDHTGGTYIGSIFGGSPHYGTAYIENSFAIVSFSYGGSNNDQYIGGFVGGNRYGNNISILSSIIILSSSSNSVGDFVGRCDFGDTYIFNSVVINDTYGLSATTPYSPIQSDIIYYLYENLQYDNLNELEFYTEILGWDPLIWNFENLDFENGTYPTLN